MSLLENIKLFRKPAEVMKKLSMDKKISFTDMREEVKRIEGNMERLLEQKKMLVQLDPTKDLDDVQNQFEAEVVRELKESREIAMEYLKDSDPVGAPVAAARDGEGTGRVGNSSSRTKTEYVKLPNFSGDEKTAYVKFSIWLQQWKAQITEYEVRYRPGLLVEHLDSEAQKKIIGVETEYEAAMGKLEKYYGDPLKVVRACLAEVHAHPTIAPYDYRALISFKTCLVNNYTRLKAKNLEHELSNTGAMAGLMRKLPIQENKEWQQHLARKDCEAKARPFPEFMIWLEEAGESWELLAAAGTGRKDHKGTGGGAGAYFGFCGESTGEERGCYRCGEEGHFKRDCPKSSGGGRGATGGGVRGYKGREENKKTRDAPKHKKFHCALHKEEEGRYCHSDSCVALKQKDFSERVRLLKENGDCPKCCRDCPKGDCKARTKRVCGGNKEGRGCGTGHEGHEMFCSKAKLCFAIHTLASLPLSATENTMTGTVQGFPKEDPVLLQVMNIPACGIRPGGGCEAVLWDTACSGRFVRKEHARAMGFPYVKQRMRVCTLGGDVKEMEGELYRCKIKDLDGKLHEFVAHGMERITGSLGKPLNMLLVQKLFPHIKSEKEKRMLMGTQEVDYLLGLGNASWQPEKVAKAKGEGDFWIWENQFGKCVGGSHPLLDGGVTRSDSLFTVLHVQQVNKTVEDSLKVPDCWGKVGSTVGQRSEAGMVMMVDKKQPGEMNDFFNTEKLGTIVEPKCGNCKCGRCPVPGSRYSHREESELKLVEENLLYDTEKKCWVARYPYLFPREALKGTKEVARKSMLATERSLKKDKKWAEVYQEQIDDMLKRGAARKVPQGELENWGGHVNYLPHLAVSNPRSLSTPVRICFDASRPQGGGPSLNQILAKGPDRYLNNLAGVIICFRHGRVACKGDVKKMYNGVRLEEEDCYCQCFLWREMDESREPETYQVIVNNIGVKPAGAIATSALYKSAEIHEEEFPVTARQIKQQSYVDDIGLTDSSRLGLETRIKEADIILDHANMPVKGWIFSGDDDRKEEEIEMGDVTNCLTAEDQEMERVLGVLWCPKKDTFKFQVRINLSPMKKKSRSGPDLTREDFLNNPPSVITRRQFYSQIQALFDPIGLLSPLLLKSKILLRLTWEDECKELDWDSPLPQHIVKEIIKFFIELYELESVVFDRSLYPQEEVEGDPWLVTFSDGSIKAFAASVYIVWKLKSGGGWSALVVSKSKIAPKHRISIPRLELNGAVLSKRLTEFVSQCLNVKFERKLHLVDSSTVLGYLHKPDSKLNPWEGLRVSEIQAAGSFEDGRLKDWAWVRGEDNPSDWATKPRSAKELSPGGFWQKGPKFLTEPFETWPIKETFRTDRLEGELVIKVVHVVVPEDIMGRLNTLVFNCSKVTVLHGAVIKVFRIWQVYKQVGCGKMLEKLEVDLKKPAAKLELRQAKVVLNKFAQSSLKEDLDESVSKSEELKVRGPFKRLSPFEDEEGVWRVGLRLKEFTPFTEDHKPPVLLPNNHRYTHLIMTECHKRGHLGEKATVHKFRAAGYWTPHAGKVARKIRQACVLCRKLDHRPIHQRMGAIPKEMLVNPVAWGHVEIDLFGPYLCRSEVNKRSTMKVWGAVVEDKNSGAVHCDIVVDYSAPAVVAMLRRYGSLRGWPVKITSDPGSQLESASGQMETWWEGLKEPLLEFAGNNNFNWEISPANSPWRQGRCEVRIRMLKRLLKVSVGDSKLSPTELQTFLFEAADMANERPLGIDTAVKSDGSFKTLTPNCLLMGRSGSSLPDDTFLAENLKKGERYQLIQQITTYFWTKWAEEITPMSVIRQKWHETGRNLRTGDIVLLHDKTPIKGKYQLGVVESTVKSADGLVRSCQVGYKIPTPTKPVDIYEGKGKWISLSRSVQRLTLLLPVEEQAKPLTVEKDGVVKLNKERQEHVTPIETLEKPVKKREVKERWILKEVN